MVVPGGRRFQGQVALYPEGCPPGPGPWAQETQLGPGLWAAARSPGKGPGPVVAL